MSAPFHSLRRLALLAGALALSLAGSVRGASAQARDDWNLQYMGDAKVGYIHAIVAESEKDGRKLWRSDVESFIAINRLGTTIKIEAKATSFEDAEGRIVELSSETDMSAQKSYKRLVVDGDQATVTLTTLGAPEVNSIVWKADYLGPLARERELRAKVEAGETAFKYLDYALDTAESTVSVKILGKKKVKVPGLGERELLHTQSTNSIMPHVVTDLYLDDSFATVMSSSNPLGPDVAFITVISTRADCVEAFAKPDEPEMFAKVSPRSNVRLPDPYRIDELVLRLRKERANDAMPPLEDGRQTILEKKSDQDLLLRVRRVVPSGKFTLPLANLTDEEKKCLERNAMIQSDDPEIVKLAGEAVGGETDAWTAACKLERFANGFITAKGYDTGFASASEVCRDKAGDCTEHGVFLAGLCRAAGLPARVAVGLLYFGGGAWGGHMWSEVSLGGKWYALDATLGRGGVDAAHLGLTTSSLNDIGIERAFADVSLGMTLDIDVVSYRHGEREVKVGEDAKVCTVEGDVYRHLLYGFTLVAPEGYEIKPNPTIELSSNAVLELDAKGGPDIDVEVQDVPLEFELDDIKKALAAQGLTRIKSEELAIDDRPARVWRAKVGKSEQIVAAVLRDSTLLVLKCRLDEGEDDAAILSVLDSLDLDG